MSQLSKSSAQLIVSTARICSPGNLRGNRTSPTTLTLSWDEPYATCPFCPDVNGYVVTGEGITAQNVVRPPCEISGIDLDRDYMIHVHAQAGPGNVSPASVVPLFKLPPPGKPQNLQLKDLTYSSVKMTWTASTGTSTGVGGKIRYKVYLNDAVVVQTELLECTLLHLRNHTDYRVEVRAGYEHSQSESEPASATFKTLLRPPILKFAQRNGIGKLSWAPNYWAFPTHEGTVNDHDFTTGVLSLGYKFRVAERSSGPPYAFKFEVRAQADGVYSEFSKLDATVDEIIPPSQPGTPMVDSIDDTSVTLSWEPSTDNTDVTDYTFKRWGGGSKASSSVPGPSCTFTGLNSGSRYLFVVRAQDAAGNESIPSEIMFKTTGPSTYPEPLAPKLTITPQTSASALLEWTLEAGGASPYAVRITINGVYYSDVFVSKKSKLLEDLVPGDEYTISVYAYTPLAAGISEPATLVYEPKDVTPPSVPGALHVVEKKTGSVTLAWEASTDDIGMYGYVIYDNFEYCDEIPDTQYTATHLYPGLHLFHVRALDVHGNASEPAVALVGVGERWQSPSRPGSPVVSERTGSSAKLTWAPSIDENGGAITYHVMRLAIGYSTYKSTSSTETTYTGLSYGSRHFVAVRAMDEAGNVSPPSQLLFKLKGWTTPDLPAPILTLEPQPPTSLMLRWTYPGDYSPQQVSIVVNGQVHDRVNGSVVSMLLDNLDPVAQYTISVLASNFLPAQLSEPATQVYGHTPVAVTSISADLRVMGASSDSVTLVWDEPASGSGPQGYLVYHHHKHVGSTLGNRYTVTGVSSGAYSFSLRALDLDGNITELGTVEAQVTG